MRYDWGFMVHRFRPVGPWWHGNLLGRHVNALESQYLSINFPMVKLFNSWWWWIVDDSSGIVELSKDIISKMLLVQIFSVTTSNNMAQSLTDGYPKNNSTGHDEVVSKCVCVFLSRGLVCPTARKTTDWKTLLQPFGGTRNSTREDGAGRMQIVLGLWPASSSIWRTCNTLADHCPGLHSNPAPEPCCSLNYSFRPGRASQRVNPGKGCGHSIQQFEGTVDCDLRQLIVCTEFKQRCICCRDVGSVCE